MHISFNSFTLYQSCTRTIVLNRLLRLPVLVLVGRGGLVTARSTA